jgi:hypothetical protein
MPNAGYFAITPSDTVPMQSAAYWIYVGVTGDIAVFGRGPSPTGGAPVIDPVATVFKSVPQGWIRFPIPVAQVGATGTTATNLVASSPPLDQSSSH